MVQRYKHLVVEIEYKDLHYYFKQLEKEGWECAGLTETTVPDQPEHTRRILIIFKQPIESEPNQT